MAPGGPYYVEVRTRSRHSRAVTRPRAARAAPPIPPGSPTPPLGPLGPQERAGDRRGARRAPPAEEPPEALSPPLAGSRASARARARPRRARGLRMRRHPSPSSRWQSARACRRVGGVVEGKVAGGRNSAAVASPALIEYRALRAAAQSESDASITTSLAAAIVAHLVAALGAVSTALDAV